jgi:hypothetical protein
MGSPGSVQDASQTAYHRLLRSIEYFYFFCYGYIEFISAIVGYCIASGTQFHQSTS